MFHPENTAIAGAVGSVLSVLRNDEGRSATQIFIRLRRIGLFTYPSFFIKANLNGIGMRTESFDGGQADDITGLFPECRR